MEYGVYFRSCFDIAVGACIVAFEARIARNVGFVPVCKLVIDFLDKFVFIKSIF